MVLLIDNYDSFSYNLVQYIGELSDGSIKVVRNDKISIEQIREVGPHRSPAPCVRTVQQPQIRNQQERA